MNASKNPEFFKVVFPDPCAHELRIPVEFHKKHLRHELQSVACLIGPTGRRWQVQTCISGGHVYLREGWQKFAKAHDLRFSDFMIFQHLGSYVFTVKIYGTSGCIKEYTDPIHASEVLAITDYDTIPDANHSSPSYSCQVLAITDVETAPENFGGEPSNACLLCGLPDDQSN